MGCMNGFWKFSKTDAEWNLPLRGRGAGGFAAFPGLAPPPYVEGAPGIGLGNTPFGATVLSVGQPFALAPGAQGHADGRVPTSLE